LWQNGRLDPDAVWSGEWGRSMDAVLDGGGDRRRRRDRFEVIWGRPIVTNGTLCMRGGDMLSQNDFVEDLFIFRHNVCKCRPILKILSLKEYQGNSKYLS